MWEHRYGLTNKKKRTVGMGLYGLGALAVVFILWAVLSTNLWLDLGSIAIFGLSACAPAAVGSFLLISAVEKEGDKGKIGHRFLWMVFLVYVLLLFSLLFVGGYRHHFGGYVEATFQEIVKWNSNIVPFKTIGNYASSFFTGEHYNTDIIIKNLVGNFFLFAPMGILLPCLFRPLRKFWRFLLVMLAALILVEIGQLAFRVGMCDIDDVILNLAGGALFYGIWKLSAVQKGLKRLYLLG